MKVEAILSDIIQHESIGEARRDRINEWLQLKAETDECVSSSQKPDGKDGDLVRPLEVIGAFLKSLVEKLLF